MDPYQVVIKPLITEKGTTQNEKLNQFTFQVHDRANKAQIREAIETIYEVRVLKVRTLKRRGKVRRYRYTHGRTAGMKKAVVTLHREDHIDLF
ncbi:MAG: 50S ribosomal protein L23 [Planctomycetota bacterium]|jgi:large subunit ribosomal protein L23|nr:50S ribosomal protein L23 [Planctomycetota bacterium]